jgi:hypothetical protein
MLMGVFLARFYRLMPETVLRQEHSVHVPTHIAATSVDSSEHRSFWGRPDIRLHFGDPPEMLCCGGAGLL